MHQRHDAGYRNICMSNIFLYERNLNRISEGDSFNWLYCYVLSKIHAKVVIGSCQSNLTNYSV